MLRNLIYQRILVIILPYQLNVKLYGSCATGLSLINSDIDLKLITL